MTKKCRARFRGEDKLWHDCNKVEHDSEKTPHRTRHMRTIVFEQTEDLKKKIQIVKERATFERKISNQPKPPREYKRQNQMPLVPRELQELYFS